MNVRLRTIAGLAFGALGIVGITASTALVVATSVLHDTSTTLLSAAESIRAAQELEGALLDHNRESLLWEVTQSRIHQRRQEAARRSLEEWFLEIEKHIGSEEEAKLVQSAHAAVERYVAERDRVEESQLAPLEIVGVIEPVVDHAHEVLGRVTELNVQQAKVGHRTATWIDRFSDNLATVLVALTLLTIPLVLWVLNRMVFRPLRMIDRALRNFAKGQSVPHDVGGVAELQTVARTVSEMADELGRQQERQLRYLAAVAHDLKNPIAAITMSSELIGHDPDERLGDGTRSFLDVIHRQAQHLGRMVNDLLDTTRIEAGQLELRCEVHDLRSVARECAGLFSSYSATHRVTLDLQDESVPCRFDPLRVAQVVNNLLSNAIKYSPYGGDVVVKVASVGGEGVLSVEDQGSGISADELEGIFEPFKRSKATKETIPGVGLGLFTARRIVTAHGGRIDVESRVGRGSTFRVHLPLAPAVARFSGRQDAIDRAAVETSHQ